MPESIEELDREEESLGWLFFNPAAWAFFRDEDLGLKVGPLPPLNLTVVFGDEDESKEVFRRKDEELPELSAAAVAGEDLWDSVEDEETLLQFALLLEVVLKRKE